MTDKRGIVVKYFSYQPRSLGAMNKRLLLTGLIGIFVLAGCQSVPRNGWPTLSQSEADAFRQNLIKEFKKNPPESKYKRLFVQASNKAEPCLIPTSEDQLKLKGFRAYWDGECRNGYAYGLGRDIAIAKDFHVEEISIYRENGDNDGLFLCIDYKNNSIIRGASLTKRVSPEGVVSSDASSKGTVNTQVQNSQSIFYEKVFLGATYFYQNIPDNGMVAQGFKGLIDEYGGGTGAHSNSYAVDMVYMHTSEGVVYKLYDISKRPQSVVNPLVRLATVEGPRGEKGSIFLAQYKNGATIPLVKTAFENRPVNLPESYIKQLNTAINLAGDYANKGHNSEIQAIQMANHYMSGVCGKSDISVPKGLSKSTYLKICKFEIGLTKKVAKTFEARQKVLEKERAEAAKLLAADEERVQRQREAEARLAVYRAQANAAKAQADAATSMANTMAWESINRSTANMLNAMPKYTPMQMVGPAPLRSPVNSSQRYMIHQMTPNMMSVRRIGG